MKAAIFFLLLALLAGVVALSTIVSPGRLSLEAATLTLLGVAAFCAYSFGAPRFVRAGRAIEDRTTWLRMIAIVFGLGVAGGFVMFGSRDVIHAWDAASSGAKIQGNTSHAFVFVCVLYLTTLLSVMLRSTRATASVIRVLAASPKGIEGTVHDPTPVEVGGEDRAAAQIVERRSHGSDPEIITEHTASVGTFFVVTDDGQRIEVLPESSTWASSMRKHPGGDIPNQKRFADVVPIGGRVWLVDDEVGGRLFYATPSGTSARAKIRRLAAMRIGAALLMLACIAGMTARAAQLAPRLPPFELGEGGA